MIFLKKITLFLCLLYLISSCQKIERPPVPDKLIPEDKMVDILTEMYLFSAAKSNYRVQLQQSGVTVEEVIYQKFEIDSLQFVESNAYYGADMERYEAIYQKVRENLEAEKQKYSIIEEQQQKDSLQNPVKKTRDSLQLRVLDSLGIERMK